MPIEEFNAVLDEFNQDASEAKDQKEQDKVSKKFEKRIDDAEKKLEEALEIQFQAELEALAKEQKEAELQQDDEIEQVDEFDPKEGEPMLSDAKRLDQKAFAKAYKVKDIRVLAETLKLPTRTGNKYIKEAKLVASIYEFLNA